MKLWTAGLVLALLIGAAYRWVPDFDPRQPRVQLHANAAESIDESPFGIAEHRRLPREIERSFAASAPGASSLATSIEALKATGDARDAYQAFRLIAKCVRAHELDDEMKTLPMGPDFAAQRQAYGDGLQRLRDACQDITTAQIGTRLSLIEKAAKAGVPGAVTARIGEGPFGDKTALEQRPNDPLVIEWVDQAIASVKAAAKRDDIEAIIQLALLSLYWELDEIDRLRVLVQYVSEPNLRDPQGNVYTMSLHAPMRADIDKAIATPFGEVVPARK
jgi:hypothetical protein